MNSNQRSQGNNQSDNGGNEKSVSSSRGGTVEKNYDDQSQQSGSQRDGSIGSKQEATPGQHSTDRSGSQTGSQQQGRAAQRTLNDQGDGPSTSSGSGHLAADQNMDDDTGLSNRANRQSADDIDDGTKQEKQSNVGRRSDMTPD